MKIKLSTSKKRAKRTKKEGSGLFLKTQLKKLTRYDFNPISGIK